MLKTGQQIIRLSDDKRFTITTMVPTKINIGEYDAVSLDGAETVTVRHLEIGLFGPPANYGAEIHYRLEPPLRACPICELESQASSDQRLATPHAAITCDGCLHFIVTDGLRRNHFAGWLSSHSDEARRAVSNTKTAERIAVFARGSELQQLTYLDTDTFAYFQVDESGINPYPLTDE